MVSSTRQAIACIFAIFSVALIAHAQTTPAKEPTGTITGTVTIKGKGTPGVIVMLRREDPNRNGREYSGPKDVTDNDGNYRIANVPPGSYKIAPVAKAFVPTNDFEGDKVLIVNKGDTIEHIDFVLVRGGVVTGKVVDAEGRPMVEEWVSLVRTAQDGTPQLFRGSPTDDRGVYRIYGVRPGSYKVAAGRGEDSFQSGMPRPYRRTYYPSADNAAEATAVEVTEGGETKDVDITFTRTVSTYSATGRVVDGETGQPVANVSYGITRYEERGSSGMFGDKVTNSRGEFKLTDLSPGKYGVSISPTPGNDLRFDDLRFEIIDQDVTGLVVKAIKGGSISGVVVFEGFEDKAQRGQFNGVWVGAGIEGTRQRASSQLGEDGSFTLRGLGEGTVNFHLYSNRITNVGVLRIERDGVIQSLRGVVVKERENVKGIRIVAQLGNASIRGKLDVENGTLTSDARFHVWARPVGVESGSWVGSNARQQVDERGQFVIEGLTAGTYEIEAAVTFSSTKLGYLARKQQVVVTAGTTTTLNITIDLKSQPTKY
jgi:protocatechuate 3,4-dioxygenase beta subunit